MVLVQISQLATASILLQSASLLASQLDKALGVLCLVENDEQLKNTERELALQLKALQLKDVKFWVRMSHSTIISSFCDELDASFLFIQINNNQTRLMRNLLTKCRELRIPYLFFKDTFEPLNLSKVILPVGFLEEELEKAQFAAAFGRFCGSEITILLANDYGSKAAANAQKMTELFDKFNFCYSLVKATKDSFKVEFESVQLANNEQAGMAIVSASRDYGLDDILFGPKEFHVIKKSTKPVLIVNPRGDLYALCD